MKIKMENGQIILAEIKPGQYEMLRDIGLLRWNKASKTLCGYATLELLDALSEIFRLPAPIESERQRLSTVARSIEDQRSAKEPVPLVKYPVNARLFAHQVRAANMALITFGALKAVDSSDALPPPRFPKGFGLLFEMGCGKTLTAISIMGALYMQGRIRRVLVVAPSSVCSVWPHDLAQFADFPCEIQVLLGEKKKRIELLERLEHRRGLHIAVINYESTHREGIFEALQGYHADLIICDESQRIKTHTAAQSRALHQLGDKAHYKLALSGTPVQNNAIDLYSQYRFLDRTVFGTSFYSFRNRYCVMGGYGQHEVKGIRNKEELVRKEYSIAYRVTKEECLDLPQQTFERRYVQLSAETRRLYERIRRDSITELEDGGSLTAPTALTRMLRLTQLTGGFLTADGQSDAKLVDTSKLYALADLMEDYVLETGKKMVVFARFRPEIAAIEQLLTNRGIKYGCIYGDIPIDARGAIVEDFQQNPCTKVFVAQLQTAGLGITLHAASVAVFYSLDYNYADYAQALARIHRIGQHNPVTYIHLLAEDSVDDKVLAALEKKEDVARNIVDSWREYFGENENE